MFFNNKLLFAAALGLTPPWEVKDIKFSGVEHRLDIWVGYPSGTTFPCPVCGKAAPVYDTRKQTWRHLNFFQHETYLHAGVPRVECPHGCGVKTINVPWARARSDFTLLFEAYIMLLVKEMPVNAVAKLVGEHDTRLWRILKHYVKEARAKADYSSVRKIGIDETSAKMGHDYISLFVDLERAKLLFATEGKGKETVSAFTNDLVQHGGKPEKIESVCCDLSPSFVAGVKEHLANAELVFDRFHIMKIVNDAVDEVRRLEAKENELLKKTRYLWLKNPEKLTKKQQKKLESLKYENLDTVKAYNIKLSLRSFFEQPDRKAGEEFLKRWYFWATHSRLVPIVKAAYTIKNHWEGILSWFSSRITNGLLEGLNSLIQAAKARARGYRNKENFITISYIIASDLDYNLPALC